MKRFVIAALTAAAAFALPVATIVVSQSAAAQWIDVEVHPPVPRVEVRTVAPEVVWVPGYWAWDGRAHVWVAGRWAVPARVGDTWHEPEWRAHNHGWRFHRGRWGR